MRKARFTEEQIIGILKEHDAVLNDSGRSLRAREAESELGTLATDKYLRHSRRAEITTPHEALWMRPRVPATPPAHKPSSRIFECAHDALGIAKDGVVHICASPHLDLVAARDITAHLAPAPAAQKLR